jgi:hypothetical protein
MKMGVTRSRISGASAQLRTAARFASPMSIQRTKQVPMKMPTRRWRKTRDSSSSPALSVEKRDHQRRSVPSTATPRV